MASGLSLRVLGPLRLERDGRELEVRGSRQREVLARLAVGGGLPVTAEALLADVWGPVAGESAAASLHVSISKLRRAIDPDRGTRDWSPLVSVTGGYALTAGSDVAEVEQSARRASGLIASGELTAAHAELELARQRWRGEAFEGVGEHSWLVLERRRCQELLLYVAALHAETTLRLGRDPAGVVVDLSPLAERHPGHERLAVLLAVALYRAHRQDDALATLRSTREHLRDHAGLDPGPEVRSAEQLILAQEPDPFQPPPRVRTSQVSKPVRMQGYPLVGRGRPRAVLAAAAAAVTAGQVTTALLVGEAGIGKTRLARTVTDDLVAQGWRTVWAHGSEGGGAPALWPWLSIVRQLGDVVPLVPQLAALVEGTPGPLAEPAADRWRQAQRIGELLDAVAGQAPLLVVIDDLHWTDAASQALLTELTARPARSQLLVLVTSRPAGSPGLTATLARMARLGVIRLDLQGLTEADVQALAAGVGLQVAPRALHERTGGNPFLLQETLAFAAETDSSPLHVIPASVTDVLGARMARLPAPAEDVLAVASVLGSIADAGAIAALAGLPPEDVDDGLDAALAAGLLRDDADGTIRFRHDLVRETAYHRLGAVRRARLHARALSRLEAAGHAAPAVLAGHARDAGPSHAGQTVRWAIAAATDSAARRAPDSALDWWHVARDADRSATVPDAGRRLSVLLGLVTAQLDAGDAVGAIQTRAEAVQAATDLTGRTLVVAALTALDGPLVWLPRPMGQVDLTMVRLVERHLLAEQDRRDRCMLLATLAIEVYSPGEEARCDRLTAEAIRLAERLGNPRTLAFALNARVIATAFPGWEAERARVADQLIDLGRTADLPSFELAGHQLAARLRLQLFEVRTADAHARRARSLADQLRLPLPALQQRLWDCSRRALDGDVPAALRLADEVQELDWPWWGREQMLATVRLTLLLRAGSWAEAAPLLDLAAAVRPGMAADARRLVTGAGPTGGPVPRDWAWLSGGCVHAQAALSRGDPVEIKAAYLSLLPGSGMIGSTGSFDAGPVDGYLADLARALDQPSDERRHRDLLAQLCAREGLPAD